MQSKARGFTLTGLAAEIGISISCLSNLEHRKAQGSSYTVLIANALDIPPEWLAWGHGDPDRAAVRLNPQEQQLIFKYRRMGSKKRNEFRDLIG